MGLIEDVVTLEVQRRPFFLRTAFGVLRRTSPVLKFGTTLLVTGEPQVREVFSRPTDFLFGFGNGPKMKLGPFLFGMDASDQYFAEKKALHQVAIEGPKVERFGELVRFYVGDVLETLPKERGRIDLVSRVIEPVLLRAGADFYGIKLERADKSGYLDADKGEPTFAQWVRKLGGVVGSTWPAPFGLEELSEKLAKEMARFLVAEVSHAPEDSVIGALRSRKSADNAALKDDVDIARCVGGLVLAGAAAIKATTLALHELLVRGSEVHVLQDLPRTTAPAIVLGYAWEALRFRPIFPILPRYCPRATTLGAGTPYETEVPADAKVVISPLAAMFDPLHVDRPERFIPTRPMNTYYHFGFGLHRCFGEQLAAQAMGELLSALFASRELQPGRIQYEGPAVARYDVTIGPRRMPTEVHNATDRADYRGADTGRAA